MLGSLRAAQPPVPELRPVDLGPPPPRRTPPWVRVALRAAPAVVLAGTIALGCCRVPLEVRCAAEPIAVDLLIVEARTGRPLRGATARLVYDLAPWRESGEAGVTDAAGRVRVDGLVPVAETRYLVGGRRRVLWEGWHVEVADAAHEPVRVPVAAPRIARPRPWRVAISWGASPSRLQD